MELSKLDMNITKGVAILMMLLLHLFCRKEYEGLYETFIYIGDTPLIYYLALFGDACVPIYCFASGYGLYLSYEKKQASYNRTSMFRIIKLLINFYIILLLFIAIGSYIVPDSYPGPLNKLLLNLLLLSNSYNGAWWFLQTYFLLILVSPFLFKVIKRYNIFLITIITVFIYLISYIQRVQQVINLGDNGGINILVNAMVLLGTSLFPFMIGSIFAKKSLYSLICKLINKFAYKNIICVAAILSLITFHGFYESMIIAPFTAIVFICAFNIMDKGFLTKKVLNFFGSHSTNMWLTHMFFYMTIFPELTFAPKYPILIFLWLIILCLISSYIINFFYRPTAVLIDKIIMTKKSNLAA
ncbi:acyltransferase family protein [Robertmurraya sp.]|uniref:acyltransferase family protein n=1 Tax=Robertmurraya sp. TaxID=2837525 RepID=UPI0037046581